MKKVFITTVLLSLIFFTACKKEKITPEYSNLLKDTEWYGEYTDKGTSNLICYAIAINNDSNFKFYTASNGFTGYWSVDANTGAAGWGTYTEPPYKNKIFISYSFLFVVDEKTVWQYNNPNNKIFILKWG
jgi:hypothetical protein